MEISASFQEKLKEFNNEQQEAILSDENTVVSAGAGAGKTKTLSARFLYLITEKKLDVSSILCLTFTTKATTEMYARIYAELKKNASNPYAKKAIENFQSARISTLDSVCNSIARYASRSYSIAPDFSIDEKASKKIAEDIAMSFFLKNAQHPTMQKLVLHHSIEDIISKLFVPMLKEYTNITSSANFDAFLSRQEEIIRYEYRESVKRLKDIILYLSYTVENVQEEKSRNDNFIKALKEILRSDSFDVPNEFPVNTDCFVDKWDDSLKIALRLMDLNLNLGGKTGEPKECKDKIKELREEFNIFNSLCNYDASFIKDVFSLFKEAECEYIEEKKMKGVLSYSDVANIALDSLKNDIGLRNYYKQSIKTIMIDEFQDNNQVQRDILFLLAENAQRCEKTVPTACELERGKLFFVGDEKQSIYAFRGADVSVFRHLMKDLDKQIKLETNYRTEKELIDIFNAIFPYIFYSDKHKVEEGIQEVPSFEAVFDGLHHFQETEGIDSSLEVMYVEKSDEDELENYLSAEETEATAVANRIKQLYEMNFKVRDKQSGKMRACKWNDFAILLRTGTKQHNYEKQLKIAGVPYTATTQKWIFKYAPLNDLYAMFRLAVYPQDRKTYAQVLKTPFVALSDEVFIKVMLKAEDAFSNTIDEILSQDDFAEDLLAFRRGRKIFEEVQQALKNKTNAEIVQLLWYKWGYRYLLLSDPSYHEFLNLYDYLFFMASEADASHLSASEFVDKISNYVEGMEKIEDMDIPTSQKKDTVKIMTVHASKGLEFPIVLIPDAQNPGEHFKKEDIVFFSERAGLSIHTPDVLSHYKNNLIRHSIIKESTAENTRMTFFFEEMREKENSKLKAEIKRLFYVAMTRAEVKVILSFVCKKEKKTKQEDECYVHEGMGKCEEIKEINLEYFLQSMKCPAYAKIDCFFHLLIYSLHLSCIKGECEKLKMSFYTLPLLKRASSKKNARKGRINLKECSSLANNGEFQVKEYEKSELPIITTAKISIDNKKDSVFLLEGKDEDMSEAMEIGEITHAYLQAILSGNDFNLASFDLSAEKIAEIEKYKDNFFTSNYGKMALEAKVKKMEYGFITKDKDEGKEKLIRGVIDLFFEHEDTVYIIDYKTDARQSEKYNHQLAIYKKAVSTLYKSMHPDKTFKMRAYIFYLRTSKAVEVL